MGSQPDDFSIDTHRSDGVVRVVVRGELDLSTAPELDAALVAPEIAGTPVRLDLSEMGFMDSSGLAVLIGARRRAQEEGLDLTVSGPNEHVRRLLDLTGTASYILGPDGS